MKDAKKIWKLLIIPYWKSEEKYKACGLFSLAVLLSLAYVWLTVRLNQFTRDLYNAFEQKSYTALLNQVYIFLILVSFLVLIFISKNIIVGFLQFSWRRWLTNNFLSRWAKNNTYYHVLLDSEHMDNPDQRISQDLQYLAFLSLNLVLTFILELVSLLSFATILWQISANFPLKIGSYTYNIKGYLLWSALIYSIIGTYFAVLVGKPLIKLGFLNEKYEANFRFSLIRLQEKREETALYNGIQTEMGYLKAAFKNIQENFYATLIRVLYLSAYSSFYINLDQLIPLILVSPMYFAGAISLGVVMQVRSAFASVTQSLSVIVNEFTNIALWRASMWRLIEFTDDIAEANHRIVSNKISIVKAQNRIRLRDVSLSTPTGREILHNINISVDRGEKVLLIGKSGIGKSTIIKTLAGLWTYGQGKITIPKEKIFFISQRPYMPIATLKEAIIYPEQNLKNEIPTSEIIKFLQDLQLDYLIDHLDEYKDWGNSLSLGEQQRISFLRVLLHKPEWIIMDEPTSSLNSQLQKLSFNLLLTHLKSATILTVGHSQELNAFHTRTINVEGWAYNV